MSAQLRGLSLIPVAALLLPACGSSPQALDAAVAADAEDAIDAGQPCDSANPGVRLHATVTYGTAEHCPYASGQGAMGMSTTGSAGATYDFFLGPQDAPYSVTRILPYPPGAQAGPGSVGFYSIVALYNWEGSSQFIADPGACVDVALTISCISLTDAGAVIDARP